jgi:hypothetical protein
MYVFDIVYHMMKRTYVTRDIPEISEGCFILSNCCVIHLKYLSVERNYSGTC